MEYFKPTIGKLFAGMTFSLLFFSLIQAFVMPLPLYICPWKSCSNLRFLILFIWLSYFVVGYILYCCIVAVMYTTKRHLKKRKKRRNK
jgi:hypothetical protein